MESALPGSVLFSAVGTDVEKALSKPLSPCSCVGTRSGGSNVGAGRDVRSPVGNLLRQSWHPSQGGRGRSRDAVTGGAAWELGSVEMGTVLCHTFNHTLGRHPGIRLVEQRLPGSPDGAKRKTSSVCSRATARSLQFYGFCEEQVPKSKAVTPRPRDCGGGTSCSCA